jgi:hypothetical protein
MEQDSFPARSLQITMSQVKRTVNPAGLGAGLVSSILSKPPHTLTTLSRRHSPDRARFSSCRARSTFLGRDGQGREKSRLYLGSTPNTSTGAGSSPNVKARRIEGGASLRRWLEASVGRAVIQNGVGIKQPSDLDAGLT